MLCVFCILCSIVEALKLIIYTSVICIFSCIHNHDCSCIIIFASCTYYMCDCLFGFVCDNCIAFIITTFLINCVRYWSMEFHTSHTPTVYTQSSALLIRRWRYYAVCLCFIQVLLLYEVITYATLYYYVILCRCVLTIFLFE